MARLVSTLFLFIFNLSLLTAQEGRDCSPTRHCGIHQNCYLGYCVCEPGYIRATQNCFPVRKYGELCYYDEQCVDHRMTCQAELLENNDTRKICLCDRFHEWNEVGQECIYTVNITVLLSGLVGKDLSVGVMAEADSVFFSLGWAGLAVTVLLVLFGVSLIIYGCCLYECYEKCTNETQRITRCPPTCANYRKADLSNIS